MVLSVTGPALGAPPAPERATVCGDSGALEEIVSVALLAPIAPGLKLTVTVQLAPACSSPTQPLVSV